MIHTKLNKVNLINILFFLSVSFVILIYNLKFISNVGGDFKTYYFALLTALNNSNIYNSEYLNNISNLIGNNGYIFPYLYPPTFLVFIYFFKNFNLEMANLIWTIFNSFLVASIFLLTSMFIINSLIREKFINENKIKNLIASLSLIMFLYILLPFSNNFFLGQVNIFVLTFIVLSLYYLFSNQKYFLSGFCLSIAFLIKITPVILIILLLKKGKIKSLVGFFSGLILFFVISIILFGYKIWLDFFTFLPNMQYGATPIGLFPPDTIYSFSLISFLLRLFNNNLILAKILNLSLTLGIYGLLCFLLFYRKVEDLFMIPLLLVFMIIISPYTYLHHVVFIFPGAAILLITFYFKYKGYIKLFILAMFCTLLCLASIDFPILYSSKLINSFIFKITTSLNLYMLLLFFGVGLFYIYIINKKK